MLPARTEAVLQLCTLLRLPDDEAKGLVLVFRDADGYCSLYAERLAERSVTGPCDDLQR